LLAFPMARTNNEFFENGQPLSSPAEAAWEDDTFPTGPSSGYTCPSSVADCTRNTASDGSYHDAPVGPCTASPISNYSETQIISMILNDVKYKVRTNNFTINSSASNHGTISNGTGGDINVTR
jgi:hypothetical protein